MDAGLLDQLEAEHREVEQLFAQLEEATEADEQRPLVEELDTALSSHMQIEETQVYPQLAQVDEEMAREGESEHALGRDGLEKLRELIGEPGFGAAVAMLKAGIAHHVEEEEGEVFPKLRNEMGLGTGNRETTKEELYEQAKAAGVEGRSSMTKDELAEAVKSADSP